jgi:carbamoyl-phosphate synthase large subunit
MKSTGEVMGIDMDFATAFAKSQIGAGSILPTSGKVFVSVKDTDKPVILPAVLQIIALGFTVCATGGTADYLAAQGIDVERVNKVAQGRPHIVDKVKDGGIAMIFNTTEGWQSLKDSEEIRRSALLNKVTQYTTASAAIAAAQAIAALRERNLEVRTLQSYHLAIAH